MYTGCLQKVITIRFIAEQWIIVFTYDVAIDRTLMSLFETVLQPARYDVNICQAHTQY